MVFHAIKNLFSPSTHILYKNNKKVASSILLIKPHLLSISSHEIFLNRVYNLKYTTNITFTYHNNTYRIEGSNLQSYYDQLVILIKPKQLMFKACNVTYYKNNIKMEDAVEVCIFKEESYYLMIVKDEVLHEEEITEANSYSVEPGRCAFIWTLEHEKVFVTFKIQFERQIDYLEYLAKYTKCIMKREIDEEVNVIDKLVGNSKANSKQSSNSKRNTTIGSNMKNESTSQCENKSINNISELKNEIPKNKLNLEDKDLLHSKKNDLLANIVDDTVEDQSHLFVSSSDEDPTNKNLIVGHQNKAFVTRTNSIGVFDLQNENLNLQSTLNLNIDPSKVLHHNNNLIVLDENTSNKLYNIDLERGTVTDEWDLNRQITDYFDSQKQKSGDIVGLNDNSLFRIDVRTKEKVVSENNYKTKTNFTCGMASGYGNFVVANKKGDLRLYEKLEKRAKRLLHGLGDEIYSIDSTDDGRYVVCTTSKYLLFYDLHSSDITSKRLQLRAEHLIYMDEIIFTPAKFNKYNDCLVTSTGRFVITWNVKDVDQNVYSIKKCKDLVVADSFMDGENILVAMVNDLKIVNKGKLKNTERKNE